MAAFRYPRTSQPTQPTGIDSSNPVADKNWALVYVPGVALFGSANPSGTLKANTSITVTSAGKSVYQSSTGVANVGFSLGTNTKLQSTVCSGVAIAKNINSGSSSSAIWRAGTGALKDGDFYIDFTSNKLRLIKANVALILQSTNTVAINKLCGFAWSYNAATGRVRIALDGILTTGTSVQTLNNSGESVIAGYDTSFGTPTHPSNVSLFALSPDEEFSDAALISASRNPWQIFTPQSRQIWVPSAGGGGGVNYSLTALSGSYVVTGNNATLQTAFALSALSGGYVVNGNTADLVSGRAVIALSGSYSVSGNTADLVKSGIQAYSIDAETGNYLISGNSASLEINGQSIRPKGASRAKPLTKPIDDDEVIEIISMFMLAYT